MSLKSSTAAGILALSTELMLGVTAQLENQTNSSSTQKFFTTATHKNSEPSSVGIIAVSIVYTGVFFACVCCIAVHCCLPKNIPNGTDEELAPLSNQQDSSSESDSQDLMFSALSESISGELSVQPLEELERGNVRPL